VVGQLLHGMVRNAPAAVAYGVVLWAVSPLLLGIVLAGVVTLYLQRRWYLVRRRRHLSDPARERAGLPMGRSRHGRRPPGSRSAAAASPSESSDGRAAR